MIEEYITAGKIVPVKITVKLLQKAMDDVIKTTGKVNFLIDGFPRSLENWNGYKEVFGIKDDSEMPTMLFFECPLPVLEARILKRAKYSGRSDDNVESLRKRFNTYKEETMPTVDIFRKAGKCVEVDTSQKRDVVYKQVHTKLSVWTDSALSGRPLSEKSEMLLGLRPYPKREKKDDKKEEAKETPAEPFGPGHYAFLAGAVAVLGLIVYKVHCKK